MQKAGEAWAKIYQFTAKPISEWTDLNIQCINKFAEQTKQFQESIQSNKKPEDFVSANINILNNSLALAADYSRKAGEIAVNHMTEAGRLWMETCQEMMHQTAGNWMGMKNSSNETVSSRQK